MSDRAWFQHIEVLEERLAWRVVSGEARIVSVQDSRLHHLDRVGTFLWGRLCEGPTSLNVLTDALVEHFVVTPDQARQDLLAFLSELEGLGLIRSAAPVPSAQAPQAVPKVETE